MYLASSCDRQTDTSTDNKGRLKLAECEPIDLEPIRSCEKCETLLTRCLSARAEFLVCFGCMVVVYNIHVGLKLNIIVHPSAIYGAIIFT